MATSYKSKTAFDSRTDLISELPADVKERIMERLPTRDAARTAVLSTHWKDVWLRHGQLVFDNHFSQCVSKCKGDGVALVNIINHILLLRMGPVKKFTLQIDYSKFKLHQSDLDRWFLYLSRNGIEELEICGCDYKLPVCIVLCRTIKKLKLWNVLFDCPVNADCLFPSVTTLFFGGVVFNHSVNGVVSRIPNLEDLVFQFCNGINNFEVSAPKLQSLCISPGCVVDGVKSRWFTLHMKSITILCLDGYVLLCKNFAAAAQMLRTAKNLQVLWLYNISFSSERQIGVVKQLLQKSPNLCELEIIAFHTDEKAASRLLQDSDDNYFINRDLKMLNTLKIEYFSGSRLQMLFVKSLLSKSPMLEKVVFKKSHNINVKILKELLGFPRASPKAQIIWLDY